MSETSPITAELSNSKLAAVFPDEADARVAAQRPCRPRFEVGPIARKQALVAGPADHRRGVLQLAIAGSFRVSDSLSKLSWIPVNVARLPVCATWCSPMFPLLGSWAKLTAWLASNPCRQLSRRP